MKVLTNTSSMFYGGIARRVSEMIADAQHRQNVDLVVLGIGRKKGTTPGNNIIKYNITLPDHIPKNVYANLRSYDELCQRFEPVVCALEKVIRAERPDVTFVEGTYYAPWCFYQASKRAGVPAVLLYAGILREEIANWPTAQKEPLMKMEQDFYDPVMHYIFPSSLTKRKVEEEVFETPLSRSNIVPNGISLEFFADQLIEKGEGVGWIGRSTYVKRPGYLMQLVNELKQLGKAYRLYMVTDAQPKLRAELARADIEVLSPMGSSELRAFYQCRGVIISPSRFETYGNVPMEALAAGTPALVSSNMGVTERFIELGLKDYITDFDDLSATIKKIEYVQSLRIPKEFRERLKKYLWSAVIGQYYLVCEQAISNS